MKGVFFFSGCFFSFLATIHADEPVKPDCLEKEKALASLEIADNLLAKAKVSFPSCKEYINSKNESECADKKSLAYIEISKKLISDVRRNFPTCSLPIEKDEKIVEDVKPSDCSEILTGGSNKNGVYTIWTNGSFTDGKSLQVYCDMETEKGGWTVIQRRGKFPVQQDFYLDWESYKTGFGNLSQEFWLGNENIRVLCEKGCELRIDLEDQKGEKGFAHYQNFNMSGSTYRLGIGGYTGNVGDSMKDHNNNDFSSKDNGREAHLAQKFKGGWWFGVYLYSNLNGIYKPAKTGTDIVLWHTWRPNENIARVEMKVRQK